MVQFNKSKTMIIVQLYDSHHIRSEALSFSAPTLATITTASRKYKKKCVFYRTGHFTSRISDFKRPSTCILYYPLIHSYKERNISINLIIVSPICCGQMKFTKDIICAGVTHKINCHLWQYNLRRNVFVKKMEGRWRKCKIEVSLTLIAFPFQHET